MLGFVYDGVNQARLYLPAIMAGVTLSALMWYVFAPREINTSATSL